MVERTVTISVLLLHLVVLAIGAYLATKGQITIGTFVTFESAFWEVSYNIAHLMHFIPVSIQAAAAVRHIQELLDEPTRGADRPGAPDLPRITNDITFDRVTFQYEGGETPVLDNLSLKLKVGKTIAIVGPSGSGKSTLLNLILRLYVPDEGRLTIDGVDIRRVTASRCARAWRWCSRRTCCSTCRSGKTSGSARKVRPIKRSRRRRAKPKSIATS